MAKTGSGDLYDILGVAKDASAQDIKRAFRTRARECHPDVAGSDPEASARFQKVREAYEVLSDPAQRARYDRRGERRANPFTNMWNRGTVNVGAGTSSGPTRAAGNDLDLEDIFNDFGAGDFGFTGATRGQPAASPSGARPGRPAGVPPGAAGGARSGPAPRRGHPDASAAPNGRPNPQPGRDIALATDIPPAVARTGGTVTVTYQRLRRADDGRTLYRYDELHDLKVPPGTRHGETLRVRGMGDAGMDGGPYGDLVVDVRVAGAPAPDVGGWDPPEDKEEAPRESGRMKMPRREDAPVDGVLRVDVGVVEAILGGRITIETPGGTVRVTIPPGTSSGTRMRLRGRGAAGPDGSPTDLFAEVRIVVPKQLDEESRRLIERFGELNPTGE